MLRFGSSSTSSATALDRDGDCVGANISFQPKMSAADFDIAVHETEDPVIVFGISALFQAWSQGRKDLPEEFAYVFSVTGVRRQAVASVVLSLQHVVRELVAIEHPYAGGSIASHSWPTEDVFELVSLNPLEFPEVDSGSTLPVDGEEEVFGCPDCSGKGTVDCMTCTGVGTLTCGACNGSKLESCAQCGGGGEVVTPGGKIIRCRACRGKGAVQCGRCRGRGRTQCLNCAGEGKSGCRRCDCHGRLKRSWQIDQHVWREVNWDRYLSERWPLPTKQLLPESVPIVSAQWPVGRTASFDVGWSHGLPEEVQSVAARLIDECQVSIDRQNGSTEHRITGVRLEILGCFAYEIDVRYRGSQGVAYLAGTRGRVLASDLPKAAGFRRWIDWLMRNFWREVDTTARAHLSANFVRDLGQGKVHSWDVQHLIPQTAKELDVPVRLTAYGYHFVLPVAGVRGTSFDVDVKVTLDVDEAESFVLCAESGIGEAHRELFPAALSLGKTLEFGRTAVVEDASGGKFFVLVDRRPYEYADPVAYADVLVSFAYDVAEIISRNTLA